MLKRHVLETFTLLLSASFLLVQFAEVPYAQVRNERAPGDFDDYLFAPSFCDTTGFDKNKQECAWANDENYQATPLTVHGLWPSVERTGLKNQPAFCTDERRGDLSDELHAQLKTYMPGVADGLDRSEWRKHGTCSGLSYEQYYHAVIGLTAMANKIIGGALQESSLFGTTIQLSDLVAAVAAKNPSMAAAISVDCQFAHPHGGGSSKAYIVELRLSVDKDLSGLESGQGVRFIPINSQGRYLNSGCPNDAGYIPGSFED